MSALASGRVYFKGIFQHLRWDTEVFHDLGGTVFSMLDFIYVTLFL
jgi:hypothetical protein